MSDHPYYAAFQCRKCYHMVRVSVNQSFLKHLVTLSKMPCPECGEESGELWIFLGIRRWKKGEIPCL